MKKIGIVGGVGWPSTIEYYRLICEASQTYHSGKEFSGPTPMPEISIESVNINHSIKIRGSSEFGSWKKWDNYYNNALKTLENSGSEIILIASVTPHARLKEISKEIKTSIISIYGAIGEFSQKNKIQNLLILGTLPTMESSSFIEGIEKFGINAFYPSTESLKQEVVNIIEQLYENKHENMGLKIDSLVKQCIPKDLLSKTAVCLGCTELPLAFQGHLKKESFEVLGVKYLNSSVIHAKLAFNKCLK